MARVDIKDRVQALRKLLEDEGANTQEELRESLRRLGFDVNQSTISRDLKRLGAVKQDDVDGRTVYVLNDDPPPSSVVPKLNALVQSVQHNGQLIIVRTDAGSASLVARQIDVLELDEIMGTIAGDDTILVVPRSVQRIALIAERLESLI